VPGKPVFAVKQRSQASAKNTAVSPRRTIARSSRVQLKPEAALGNTLAAIVTFLLYGELQWFRHFPHI
jgi:hypothetical protein